MAYVFRGGIYFNNEKNTRSTTVDTPVAPAVLYIPLAEGQTPPSEGSRVLRGQLLAPSNDGSPAVHSPVSGAVSETVTLYGKQYLKIENDGKGTVSPDVDKMNKKLADCTAEEIVARIRHAGICDPADGAPTADKLERAVGLAGTCIINCAEAEPYVSCDLAVAASSPATVVNGLKIFLRALGIRRGIIAVPEGVPAITKKLTGLTRGRGMISVMTVSSKYPQGDERRLAYAVTGREPAPHADTVSVGCVIFNVQTCIAVYDAFVTGMPETTRVVSVGGDCVRRHVNVRVPIGTRFSDLTEYAGGLASQPSLILDGGPLRGVTATLDDVVTNTTRAVLFFKRSAAAGTESPVCIRCGRCVSMCPEGLMPNYIYNYLRDGKNERAVRRGALDCVGCGICSYICPGKAPVAELIAEFRTDHNKPKTDGEADV